MPRVAAWPRGFRRTGTASRNTGRAGEVPRRTARARRAGLGVKLGAGGAKALSSGGAIAAKGSRAPFSIRRGGPTGRRGPARARPQTPGPPTQHRLPQASG